VRGERGAPLPDPNLTGESRTEIFSVSPDGSDEQVLSDNRTLDRDPAFSPDGTKIAFAGRRDNVQGEPQNTEIYVADNDGDLEGPDLKRLTFNDGTLSTGTKNGVAATDQSPSWSPDGTQIVLHSGRETTFDGWRYLATARLRDLQDERHQRRARGGRGVPDASGRGQGVRMRSRRGRPMAGRSPSRASAWATASSTSRSSR